MPYSMYDCRRCRQKGDTETDRYAVTNVGYSGLVGLKCDYLYSGVS